MTNPEARLNAAAALRDLNHAFVGHDRSTEHLRALAEFATSEAASIREGERRDRLALIRSASAAQGGLYKAGFVLNSGFDDRAVAGTANPTSIDIDVRYEGDEVVADLILRHAFEGAPGRAHGGIVAAAFDDVTGFVIGRLEEPAFTGELTVRFVAPVPVEETIVMRAWLESRERRKLFIVAEATVGEHVVATCHAIYIKVDPAIFAGSPDPR